MKRAGYKPNATGHGSRTTLPMASALALAAALGAGAGVAQEASGEGDSPFVISGTLEIEASAWDGDSGNGSDVSLATVELGFDAQVNQYTHGHLLFLYEEGENDDNISVDEATITIANQSASPAYFSAGRMYVPFGNFESNMISDPLTLEIGETQESALQLGWQPEEGIYGSIFVFNGNTDDGGGDKANHWGANAGLALGGEEQSLDLGVGFISSIGDSDGLDLGVVDDYAKGFSAHAIANFGPLALIGEYVGAMENVDGPQSKVQAYNLEAGYHFPMAGKEATFALGYQRTKEAEAFDLPKERKLATLSVDVYENTSVAVEWAREKGYDGSKDDIGTVQLATGF